MAQMDYTRAAKYFLLADYAKAFMLGMRYFFAPKTTINYPHEKGPLSPRFRGEHALAVIQTAKNVASLANCVKRSAPRRPSPSTPKRARTAAAAPRAMTSI